jgi:SEC-C motif-containing protein
MQYVLSDGKGKRIAITSLCEDITYAQAEVLFFAEKLKGDSISPFIVGFPTAHPALSVARFLDSYKTTPKDLARLEELRAKIMSKGFNSLVVRDYVDDFATFSKSKPDVQIGRSMEGFVDEIAAFRRAGEEQKIEDIVEAIYANPLHAGTHLDFPATVSEEIWITDAAKSIRKSTPERWLRRMLTTLRFYLKGQPKVPLPHKNDHCPCSSGRKYGKCCGAGVEIDDPEDCKLAKHTFTTWREIEDKYVRSCERCYRVYEAPWFDKSKVDGTEVVIIGCRACAARPSLEEIRVELNKADVWNSCGACGKSMGVAFMLLEHQFSSGKHLQHWMGTEIINKEDSIDVSSNTMGKMAFLHKDCFMKAVPQWPKVARPISPKDEISMQIPSPMSEYAAPASGDLVKVPDHPGLLSLHRQPEQPRSS